MCICGFNPSEFTKWKAQYPLQDLSDREYRELKLINMLNLQKIWQDRDGSDDIRSSRNVMAESSHSEESLVAESQKAFNVGLRSTQSESQKLVRLACRKFQNVE
jgi:hypothetical protein